MGVALAISSLPLLALRTVRTHLNIRHFHCEVAPRRTHGVRCLQIDFEALFAKSPNPYVILNADLVLVWMNDAYLNVTMRDRDDITGRTIFEAFPSDPNSESRRQLDGSFRHVLETGEEDELALIRYDIPRSDGALDVRYWSATHTPLKDDNGRVRFILQHTVDVTELHNLRRMRDEIGVIERASAVQARNLDLMDKTRRLEELFAQAPGFVAVLSGPEHRFQMANQAYRNLVGRTDLVGKIVPEALPEVVEQGFIGVLDKVFDLGEPYFGKREKILLAGDNGQEASTRFLNFIYQPIREDNGSVTGIFVQGYDVTEEVEFEERQALLIHELNHRVKNTLAIVQGLAGQSFRQIPEAYEAKRIFDARLKALAAAHTLLTEASWGAAQVEDVVRRSVEATAGDLTGRFSFAGSKMQLQPQNAVSLAMIMHELSTNAIKYGALSTEEGHVDVRWGVEDDMLHLEWKESGGPRVEKPERKSFGTRLIERGISSEAGSHAQLLFEPDGLRCIFNARLQGERA